MKIAKGYSGAKRVHYKPEIERCPHCTRSATYTIGETTLTHNGATTGQYSDEVTVSATLIDVATGNGINGKTINFHDRRTNNHRNHRCFWFCARPK